MDKKYRSMLRQGSAMIKKILVGVDGSDKSIAALRWAKDFAAQVGATIEVLTTWQTPFPTVELVAIGFNLDLSELNERPEQIALYRLEKSMVGAFGTAHPEGVTRSVEEGYAALVLVEKSKNFDLLVLGNRGHSPLIETLLGSVSAHCLAHAHCPVTIVKE
jgi:nucleotide-binding universal stress UspA family protein